MSEEIIKRLKKQRDDSYEDGDMLAIAISEYSRTLDKKILEDALKKYSIRQTFHKTFFE